MLFIQSDYGARNFPHGAGERLLLSIWRIIHGDPSRIRDLVPYQLKISVLPNVVLWSRIGPFRLNARPKKSLENVVRIRRLSFFKMRQGPRPRHASKMLCESVNLRLYLIFDSFGSTPVTLFVSNPIFTQRVGVGLNR